MKNSKSRNKKVNELENNLQLTQQENTELKVLIEQLKNQIRFNERISRKRIQTDKSKFELFDAKNKHMYTVLRSAEIIIENSKEQNATTDAVLSIIKNSTYWYAKKEAENAKQTTKSSRR